MAYTLLQNVVRFAQKHSDDNGTKVGACLVSGGKYTFGTNKFYHLPEGKTKEETLADRTLKYAYITHAEVDAINRATTTVGGVLYVNYTPCDKCAQAIVDAGIVKVVAVRPTDPALIERWTKFWVLGKAVLRDGGVEYVEE